MKRRALYDSGLKVLLADAAVAYRRRDKEAFHALLKEAVERAPHRQDLWFDLASHHIQVGAPEQAVAIFQRLAETWPRDVDALFCAAHWLDYADERSESGKMIERLAEVRPEAAGDLQRILTAAKAWIARQPDDRLPPLAGIEPGVTVVALGHELLPDGGIGPLLAERLEKTLEAANYFTEATIVVSGGVPRSGKVEAVEMRNWLVEHGIDAGRIHEEGYARDQVENLIYSRHILDATGCKMALIITSAGNVRRAGAALDILGWRNGSPWTAAVTAASGESFDTFPDDGGDRLKIYRDALRAYGMPMMRTFPELVEL